MAISEVKAWVLRQQCYQKWFRIFSMTSKDIAKKDRGIEGELSQCLGRQEWWHVHVRGSVWEHLFKGHGSVKMDLIISERVLLLDQSLSVNFRWKVITWLQPRIDKKLKQKVKYCNKQLEVVKTVVWLWL